MVSVIGMVRYSVAAAFANVYSDEQFSVWGEPYFSERLAMFKSITLKSLKQQTNKDFILLIYHSEQMPEAKKKIFADLEKDYPFIRNIYISGAKMELPEDLQQNRVLTFRIDNDDGVPADFIEKLAVIYARDDGFYDNVALTIPRIRKIAHISEDQYQTDDSIFVSNSIGLAYMSIDGQNIMNCGNHRLVPYHYKTVFIDGTGGLQVIHGTNVANGFKKIYDKKSRLQILSEKETKELLQSEGYPDMDLKNIPILSTPY